MAALRDYLGHRVSPCLLHGAVATGDTCPHDAIPLAISGNRAVHSGRNDETIGLREIARAGSHLGC